MATKYWTAGGSGNWSDSNNWSTTLGPPRTANTTAPGATDAAVFDATSGSGTATLDISPTIQTLTCTGFTGTLAFGTNTITLNSTGTVFTGATTMAVTGTPLIILTTPTPTASARTITPTAVTEANSISFRITSGTGSMVVTAGTVRDLDFTDGTNPTGFAGNVTNTALTIYGNFKASTSGMTRTAGTQTYTFAATSGTKTITTAAVVFDNPFTFNGVGGTFQLQDPFTSGATRTCTLTAGTLDLNNFTLTTGLFSSANSNTRTLAFGTGKIVVNATSGTVFNINTSTGLTVSGTGRLVEATSGGAGTRTFGGGISLAESSAVNILVSSGSDIVSFSGTGGSFGNVSFVGFTGTLNIAQNQIIYGSWTFGSGMAATTTSSGVVTFSATSAKTITSNGKAFGTSNTTFNGVGGSWQLQDAFGTGGAITLTNGTLDLNGYTATGTNFSSSNSNVRTLAFGSTGKLALSGNSGSTFAGSASTNMSVTGTNPLVQFTYSGGTGSRNILMWPVPEAQSISVEFLNNATDTVTIQGTLGGYRNIDFTSFNGIVNTANTPRCFGNFTLGASVFSTSSTQTLTFASTSGTKTITSNGKTIDFPITFDGIGGTFACQDALTLGSTRALTMTNGTLQLKSGTTNTVGTFVATSATIKSLQATTPGSQATISQASGTVNATNISIQDSNATGGAVWNASNTLGNVNLGNNTGWRFSIALSSVSGTGAVGTVSSNIVPTALTGVQATGAVGDLYPGWYLIPTTQNPAWANIIQS